MNFTPRLSVSPLLRGTLILTAVGWLGWPAHGAPAPAIAAQTNDPVPIISTVEVTPDFQAANHSSYQPAAWYKNKNWWRKHAPAVGAGGGALVGGIAGGAPGAIIGGAAGAGGGYLYKRHYYRHHGSNYHGSHYQGSKHYTPNTSHQYQH